MIENPEFEICIPQSSIITRLKQNKMIYEDNETKNQRIKLENQTRNEKSNQAKRDLYAKWSIENGFNSARMVDQIELEEEEIVEEVNKETISTFDHQKHQMDDIYYLDGNNTLIIEETNQTNSTNLDDKQSIIDQQQIKDQKFHLDQHQMTNFNHFSEDDENDNEDGDSDLDQVISTTTITSIDRSLNYALDNRQTNKKQ